MKSQLLMNRSLRSNLCPRRSYRTASLPRSESKGQSGFSKEGCRTGPPGARETTDSASKSSHDPGQITKPPPWAMSSCLPNSRRWWGDPSCPDTRDVRPASILLSLPWCFTFGRRDAHTRNPCLLILTKALHVAGHYGLSLCGN